MASANNGAAQEAEKFSKFCEAIRALERKRDSRICCVIHRASHICQGTKWWLRRDRENAGRGDRIEILLYSPGGHPEIAYQTMKFFRGRYKEINVIVPLGAKSAATLMCLGADKIYMGELAELGPIDIQLGDPVEQGGKSFSPLDEFKSMEYMRDLAIEWLDYYAAFMHERYEMSIHDGLRDAVPLVSELMRPIFEQIDPIEMGGNRRAIAISEEYARRMLAISGNPKYREIVKAMVWEYPSHDFCIDFDEADAIGLPVERLPYEQDLAFCDAIFMLERGEYHGFVSQPQAQKKPSKPVRSKRTAPSLASRRPNGGAGEGAGERGAA